MDLWLRHGPPSGYPAGVREIPRPLPGVGFFPGGMGLWDARPGDPLPAMPIGGVMVLGHNFDDETNYAASLARGQENLAAPTWRNLLQLLDSVHIPRTRCFFTNFFVGLLAGSRSTGAFPGATDPTFVAHCRHLLADQLRVQRPALVITLGIQVPRLIACMSSGLAAWTDVTSLRLLDEAGPLRSSVAFEGVNRPVAVVALIHPSLRHGNLRWRRYAGREGDAAEEAMLRDAVEASGIDLYRVV